MTVVVIMKSLHLILSLLCNKSLTRIESILQCKRGFKFTALNLCSELNLIHAMMILKMQFVGIHFRIFTVKLLKKTSLF